MRLLAGFTAALILASYVSTYLLLSQQTDDRFTAKKYGWLGAQSGILVLRFVLWGYRPAIIPERKLTLFYMVMGSVVEPLQLSSISASHEDSRVNNATGNSSSIADKNHSPASDRHLTNPLIRYAAAVARSKRLNDNPDAYIEDLKCTPPNLDECSPHKIDYSRGLDRLANNDRISCDIIRSVLRDLDNKGSLRSRTMLSDTTPTNSSPTPNSHGIIEVIRIPWDFVEELYAAQGVILSNTPWEYGMIYLGAMFKAGEFHRFITMSRKPKAPSSRRSLKSTVDPDKFEFVYAKVTYEVSDTEPVAQKSPKRSKSLPHVVESPHRDPSKPESDEQFIDSVRTAWEERERNGPESVEFHAQYLTTRGLVRTSKTEPDLKSALQFARETIKKAQLNINRPAAHANCTSHCAIHHFDVDYDLAEPEEDVFTPKTKGAALVWSLSRTPKPKDVEP